MNQKSFAIRILSLLLCLTMILGTGLSASASTTGDGWDVFDTPGDPWGTHVVDQPPSTSSGSQENSTSYESLPSTGDQEMLQKDSIKSSTSESALMTLGASMPSGMEGWIQLPALAIQEGGMTTFANSYLTVNWQGGYSFGTINGIHYKDWPMWKLGGDNAYCLDFYNNISDTSGTVTYISSATNTSWSSLPKWKQQTVSLVSYFGYGSGGAHSGSAVDDHIATQILIWELAHGAIDQNLNRTNNAFYNTFAVNSSIQSKYEQIIKNVKTVAVVPSFSSAGKETAPTHQLQSSGGSYQVTLTDTKNVLSNFDFTATSGVNVSKSGNSLTLTSSSPISSDVLFQTPNKALTGATSAVKTFWTGTNAQGKPEQIKFSVNGVDPIEAYFKVSMEAAPPPAGGEYEIIIEKRETGTGTPLAGATFRVTHHGHGTYGDFTTDSIGKIELKDLPWAGTWEAFEIDAPSGYVLDPNNHQTAYVDEDNPSTTLIFYNEPYTSVEVVKVDAVTNQPLAGATIKLSNISTGMEYSEVTDANGVARFIDLEPGGYYAEEVVAPDGYVLNTTKYPVQLISHQIAKITIPNQPYTGIEVTKIDAATGVKLAGAVIKLTHIPTSIEYSKTTGADGIAYFGDIPPGAYWVEETQAPTGYILNNTRYPLQLLSGQLATISIANHKMDGLVIKKVDPNGKPIAGAVFELRRGSGAVITRETTDVNGIIYRGNLSTDTYVIEEIQAPDGYILDPNNPQSIHIDSTDPNKEYTVTFVNQKKPAIEITKVDAKNPSKLLSGASFRISEQGGSKSWDITTGPNGKALLENLDVGITYLVEEIQAPNGYINAGYRETIVLEAGKVHTITVSNEAKPSLTIVKKDSATGMLLFGASFRVSWNGGSDFRDVTTDANGKAVLESLSDGWYTIVELRAPDGYLLDNTPKNVLLTQGTDGVIELFNEAKPSLKLLKVDSVTKTPLPNAEFEIYRKTSSAEEFVGKYISDANGEVLLEDILPGRYLVKEMKAPDGYNIDTTAKEITIESGQTYVLEFPNTPKSPIYILKLDLDTGTPLAGAKFKVSTMNGSLIGTFTSSSTGYAIVPYAEPGWYIVEEIQAPAGYIISSAPVNIELKSGKPAQVEMTNRKKPGLQILKVDAQTQQPLQGAKIKVSYADGRLIGEYTSDSSGLISLPDLDTGTYLVSEVKAPDGYLLDGTVHTVTLTAGKQSQITLLNTQKPGLRIQKVDSESGKPLPGATIKVTLASGQMVGEYKSDTQGLVILPDLDAGVYFVSEVKAPDGYILDMTLHSVTLEPGNTATVTLNNTAKPGLQLMKKDKLTGKPVAGAMFNVTRLENGAKRDLGSYTTGENGTFFIPALIPGQYVITELQAAPGYILDATPQNVFIEAGKLNTVEVFNIPYGDLRLLKIDSETRQPLEGAVFKLYDHTRREMGTYTTTALGEVLVGKLSAGTYYIQEVKAPAGFVLDNTVRQIELEGGKTTTLEIKNTALGSLRLLKIDAETKKPLYGAVFLLYDAKDNLLGEHTTDQNGVIAFSRNLPAGTYKVKEIKAPSGYVLDQTIHSVVLKAGETTLLEIKNTPETGNVQVVKVASDKSSITKVKKGDGLEGAVFEIFDEQLNLVDTIRTDHRGHATSIDLPLGKYVMKEVEAPKYFFTDGKPIYFEIKKHDDLIRFTVENKPEEIIVKVEKRGNVQAMPGDVITYNFSEIANLSNCDLEEFYWRDVLPTDAVRIQSLNTGTWNQRVKYDVWVKTNLKDWKRIKSGLHSESAYTIDLTPAALGLAANEYVTEYKLVFDGVEAGFKENKAPFITCKVLETLPDGYRFVNRTDVGGRRGNEWTIDQDSWVTVIFKPKKPLPKTGY